MPDMFPSRIGLGYDGVVSSLTTHSLATNKEVLFVAGGVQTDDKSLELIDEGDIPNMSDSKNLVANEIVVDIPGCSIPESTLDPKPIYLDHCT